jgi:hypothetical protein
MNFKLLPIVDKMLEFYSSPRSLERFQEYISTLQGDSKGDMQVPITGFNPMAKEHVREKLMKLKNLKAEEIMSETLNRINATLEKQEITFQVVLNLADDLKGGWTNRFTTDFDTKFKISALVNRNFCTPYFWTSENYSEEIIAKRTQEYTWRTIHQISFPKPKTLKEHLDQEIVVAVNCETKMSADKNEIALLEEHFSKNKESEDYSLIFNFFYGDEASESLSYPTYGIKGKLTGYDLAKIHAQNSKTNLHK